MTGPREPRPVMTYRYGLSRNSFRAIVFLFCFALILGVLNLLFTSRAVNQVRAADAKAAMAAASVTQLCEAINGNRQRQVILWDHIITLFPAPPHRIPRQQQEQAVALRALDAYVHRIFAPRNCHAPFSP